MYPLLVLQTESSLKIMCAHRQNACKHGCLQALLPYFLFWTFLLLHQLTSRCEDRLGSLAPAVIFIAVRNKAISFHPLLNYFTLFDPLSLIYVPQTHYAEGDCIIRQGATGDTFYIISKGQVKCYALCSLHRWNEAFSKKDCEGQNVSAALESARWWW